MNIDDVYGCIWMFLDVYGHIQSYSSVLRVWFLSNRQEVFVWSFFLFGIACNLLLLAWWSFQNRARLVGLNKISCSRLLHPLGSSTGFVWRQLITVLRWIQILPLSRCLPCPLRRHWEGTNLPLLWWSLGSRFDRFRVHTSQHLSFDMLWQLVRIPSGMEDCLPSRIFGMGGPKLPKLLRHWLVNIVPSCSINIYIHIPVGKVEPLHKLNLTRDHKGKYVVICFKASHFKKQCQLIKKFSSSSLVGY